MPMSAPCSKVPRSSAIALAWNLPRGRPLPWNALEREALRAFIEHLALPEADKQRLLALTPAAYHGLAPALARDI